MVGAIVVGATMGTMLRVEHQQSEESKQVAGIQKNLQKQRGLRLKTHKKPAGAKKARPASPFIRDITTVTLKLSKTI
jgi:hypothetical protein